MSFRNLASNSHSILVLVLIPLTKTEQIVPLFERFAYLLRHQHDETVVLHRVLSQRLGVVLHYFAVRNQLLRLCCVAMSCLNLLLQITDLQQN